MASNVTEEEILDLLRQQLNSEKIKLWLSPYTLEDGDAGEYPEALIVKYSSSLNLPKEVIAEAIENLRQHAVTKLAARKKFQQQGIATLKVKLSGNTDSNGSKTFDVEMKLDASGFDLKKRISDQSKMPAESLKLISCGHVIEDDRQLSHQWVRHNSQVMVICLSEGEMEARSQEEQASRLARTKDAAQALANRKEDSDHDNYFIQIADQDGKPLELPDGERRALSMAMMLNEKGRACLKRKQYGEALVLLLEADGAFKLCRSEILTAVDNYAVLCLDIVWCYLCLENVSELPDAESRLTMCQDCFRRSYGDNLERLAGIKGDSSRELALYVRLYLLQGILAFYHQQHNLALTLLNKAETTLNSLQVDESKLMQVVSMGFDISEARLCLRATGGNVSNAITKITERRERKKEIIEKEKEKRQKKRLALKLGKTADGQKVNIEIYESLVGMGFPTSAVAASLRQTNNDLHRALELLQEQPELLQLATDPDEDDDDWKGVITDSMIAMVTEVGFQPLIAREALQRYRGNIEKTVQALFACGGVLPPRPSKEDRPGTSRDNDEVEIELTEEQKKAVEELIKPDIPENEEDYLDLTLDDEAKFIEQYKTMLASLRK
ncbi:NEDD8 ultimate buster 1-like [Amphiura filiformis]|uniref:NEDD8 ultimate buster 1-like n=1 Tax=Amphiura filiformis TaxID=82378 RepID=UPI003B21DBD8